MLLDATDPVVARYGVRLVTPTELKLITGYGSAKWRTAAADGHLVRYGDPRRPKYDLGEVLEHLRNPRPVLTRRERLGAGPRLQGNARLPFAA
ncbi:hypothetical protein [Actinotalea sp. JY-7885]|uniref:hypothetical protein n=1 Tax=Actinotalea sp. JY-7885 TaxID=2758576 RepID=UPI00165DA2BA|nr:hypothetical protein [Actinotalea sp. JY-7885]